MASLARYVTLETMQSLLFNYYETSFLLTKGKYMLDTYVSHYPTNEGINIVILEVERKQKDGRHIDWYIGTFKGQDMSEIKGEKGQEKYIGDIKSILNRNNRVAAKDLEKRLQNIKKEILIQCHI